MARLRKREDGNYQKRFTVNGKRYSVYGKTIAEAEEKAIAKKNAIRESSYVTNKNITLSKYYEEWLAGKRGVVKPNTLRGYSATYKTHIATALGNRRIRSIEKREIRLLQDTLQNKQGIKTANRALLILQMILGDAVRDEIITTNPARSIKPLRDKGTKARVTTHRALTIEEQQAFFCELKKGNGYYYPILSFMVCTGVRQGEAAALTWKDIDFKNRQIHIASTATCSETGKRTIGSPKSDSGERVLPMKHEVYLILKAQRERNKNIFSLSGTEFVFPSVSGDLMGNCSANYAIRSTLKSLEEQGVHIDDFTSHCMRDTFATRFVESGGDLNTLKELLGHSTLAMTADIYAHILPNTKREEMQRMEVYI